MYFHGLRQRPQGEIFVLLTRESHRSIEKALRGNHLKLPGVHLTDYRGQDTMAPTYDVKQFGLTAPIDNKFLAWKQCTIDEWSCKFSRLKEDFDKLYTTLKSLHQRNWRDV